MTRWFMSIGGVVMMLVTATGGLARAGEPETEATPAVKGARVRLAKPELGLALAVSPTTDGGYLLSASAGDLVFRKVVYADGRFHVQIERGQDRMALSGEPGRIHVTHGTQSLSLNPAEVDEKQARRVRALLMNAPVVAQFRRLIAELEDSEELSVEILGLRLTGALVAELDGDEGAGRRLKRALIRELGVRVKQARTQSSTYGPDCWAIYTQLVLKASYDLERCLNSFYTMNPIRHLCTFYWTLQVESAWFSLLGCSAVPLK